MISRYKFFSNIYNEEIEHTQKGLMEDDIKNLFKSNKDILYKIPKEEEFRPDLIAQKFYGNPKLYWVLIYVNEFGNSPEDFVEGKRIRITHYDRVLELI